MHRKISKPSGSFVVAPEGQELFWDWYESDAWEPDTCLAFSKLLTPQTKYLDLGGFVGPTALLAACVVARVAVVEPNPLNRESLVRNFALNPELQAKTTVHPVAVSDIDGEVKISLNASESSLYRRQDGEREVTVPMIEINHFLKIAGMEDVDFIKIDIEGAEYEVISAMAAFLDRNRPAIWLATHAGYRLSRRSFFSKVKSAATILWLNWKMLRVLIRYKHYYTWDEARKTFVESKGSNWRRLFLPLPTHGNFSCGGLYVDRAIAW